MKVNGTTPEVLTPDQAAAYLHVDRETVWGEIDATTSSRTSCRASSAQSP